MMLLLQLWLLRAAADRALERARGVNSMAKEVIPIMIFFSPKLLRVEVRTEHQTSESCHDIKEL
jgi:hypothetical protein